MVTAVRDGYSYEELLFEDHVIRLDTEEDFKQYPRGTCNCEKPIGWKGANPVAGTGVYLRLCCTAKELEKLAGLTPGTLYQVFDFEPSWVWDCNRIERHGGTLGSPPPRVLKRLKEKGIEVLNLPEGY